MPKEKTTYDACEPMLDNIEDRRPSVNSSSSASPCSICGKRPIDTGELTTEENRSILVHFCSKDSSVLFEGATRQDVVDMWNYHFGRL